MAQSMNNSSVFDPEKLEVRTLDEKKVRLFTHKSSELIIRKQFYLLYKNICKNRALFTKVQFAKGECLFTEKPIVSAQFAWNQFYNYRVESTDLLYIIIWIKNGIDPLMVEEILFVLKRHVNIVWGHLRTRKRTFAG